MDQETFETLVGLARRMGWELVLVNGETVLRQGNDEYQRTGMSLNSCAIYLFCHTLPTMRRDADFLDLVRGLADLLPIRFTVQYLSRFSERGDGLYEEYLKRLTLDDCLELEPFVVPWCLQDERCAWRAVLFQAHKDDLMGWTVLKALPEAQAQPEVAKSRL